MLNYILYLKFEMSKFQFYDDKISIWMDISENYILYPRLYKNVKYRKNVEISKKLKKK